MTHEEKIDYMRIASGICNYGFNNEQLDMLVSLYELVLEKKGDATMQDCSKLQVEVKYRASVKKKQELLDKISDKVE